MISKLLICPFFGDLPPWMDHWRTNAGRLQNHGYEFLFEEDEPGFHQRVRDRLGIEAPALAGTGRIWNYRPAFGVLYADEIASFDFWGHTDFDCVYGRVEEFIPDALLADLDILANHVDYISGPWTLYRNVSDVNELFMATDEWVDRMEGDDYKHGWAEKGFTEIVDISHERGLIRRRYELMQTQDWDSFDTLRLDADGRLLEGDDEVMMAHFRRMKQYPAGCVL